MIFGRSGYVSQLFMRRTLPSGWYDLGMLLLVQLLLVDLLLVGCRIGILWRIVGYIVQSVVFTLI